MSRESEAQRRRNLEVNGIKPERTKTFDLFKTPHFLKLSRTRRERIKRGVNFGIIEQSMITHPDDLRQLNSDINSAEHEDGHWSALIGLENAGRRVSRVGMSVIRTAEYRAVTWFNIDRNAPRLERAWIVLVAAMGSGTGVDHEYRPTGRGGDQSQEDVAANVISIEQYRGNVDPLEVKSQAKEVSHGYVKQFSDERRILRLAVNKTAA